MSIQTRYVQAWSAIKNPELDGINPHFKNQYATLKSTLKVIRDACASAKVAYIQRLTRSDDGYRLESSVMDETGEVLDLSVFPVETPPNPQSFGSNLTYCKRQQAQADWGITGDVDDDGNAAAKCAEKAVGSANKKKAPATSSHTPTDKRKKMLTRCAELAAKCIENGMNANATESYMAAHFGVESMNELNDAQLVEYGTYLRQMEEQSRGLKERLEERLERKDRQCQ